MAFGLGGFDPFCTQPSQGVKRRPALRACRPRSVALLRNRGSWKTQKDTRSTWISSIDRKFSDLSTRLERQFLNRAVLLRRCSSSVAGESGSASTARSSRRSGPEDYSAKWHL